MTAEERRIRTLTSDLVTRTKDRDIVLRELRDLIWTGVLHDQIRSVLAYLK